jgi:hypothetical protein
VTRSCLFAIVVAVAAPASAADFTFDVPVRVQNVPSMHTLYLSCTIYTAYPGGTIMARGESGNFPITGGAYEGTVTIEVNADGIRPAAEARAYACSLEGLGTARTGATYRSSASNFRSAYETATGHTLTTANNTVRGTVP